MPKKIQSALANRIPVVVREHPFRSVAATTIGMVWLVLGFPHDLADRWDVVVHLAKFPIVGRSIGALSGAAFSWQTAVWITGIVIWLIGGVLILQAYSRPTEPAQRVSGSSFRMSGRAAALRVNGDGWRQDGITGPGIPSQFRIEPTIGAVIGQSCPVRIEILDSLGKPVIAISVRVQLEDAHLDDGSHGEHKLTDDRGGVTITVTPDGPSARLMFFCGDAFSAAFDFFPANQSDPPAQPSPRVAALDLAVTRLGQYSFRLRRTPQRPLGGGWLYAIDLRITNREAESVTLIPELLVMTDPEYPEHGPRHALPALEAPATEIDAQLRWHRQLNGELGAIQHLMAPITIPAKGTVRGYLSFRLPEILIRHFPGPLAEQTPEMSPAYPPDTDRLTLRDELSSRIHVVQPFDAFDMQRTEAYAKRIVETNRERIKAIHEPSPPPSGPHGSAEQR